MINVFMDVILPVFLMTGAGALIGRVRRVPASPISQLTLFIFSPCLVCHSLANMAISTDELGLIASFGVAMVAILYFMAFPVAKLLRMERSGRSAFLLAVLFTNAGNFGLPVALFAFGQAGLDRAVIFFVVQATMAGTLAIYIASSSHMNLTEGLRSVIRMPMLYATFLGLLFNLFGIEMPNLIARPVEILGNAAVPSMLMVLGIQLSTQFSLDDGKALISVTVLRLVVSAGVGYLLTIGLGITGLTQQVLVVAAALPTAVFTIILAAEFEAKPSFVTNAVLVTTLVSIITVTPLITLVQSYLG